MASTVAINSLQILAVFPMGIHFTDSSHLSPTPHPPSTFGTQELHQQPPQALKASRWQNTS